MKLTILVFALISISALCSDNQFIFCDSVNSRAMCAKKDYAHAVSMLPICCVDIFVYNPLAQKYFMVMRRQKPAQHEWWYPGGRLFKGESFFECAQRKCYQECGLFVIPTKILGVYSTIFPDSEWDCQTHTVNVGVFALVAREQINVHLDDNHEVCKWVDMDIEPANVYLKEIYASAKGCIEHNCTIIK